MKNIDVYNKLDKYLKKVDLIDYYITKNICKLIENNDSYNFIVNNPMLLGVINKSNKNSLIILLENKKYEKIINLININNELLKFKNYNENTLFNILLQHNYLYDFINEIILNFNIFFVTELLTHKNKEEITFISIIIKLLNECGCENLDIIEYDKIIIIFKSIMNLDKEKNILLITTICREIKKNKMTFDILDKIINKNTIIYSDEYLLNGVDYLLLKNDILSLNLILNRVEKIKFCSFENLFVFNYTEMNAFDDNITQIILKIIDKSNIYKFKNKNNENLLEILINQNKIEISKLKKYFKLFNFIKHPKLNHHKIYNLKPILTKAELNNFSSNPMSNMLYTLHILKTYDNVTIPNYIKSNDERKKDNILIELSNMDYLLVDYLKIYNGDYNQFIPYLMIWKNKWNYYIDKHLINFLINNKKKQFVLIKLSLILFENSNVRHANYLIVDNKRKIIERFEPYGEIEIDNSLELNKIIEKNICKKINYKFVFSQLYPGFQIKSDELNDFNRNIGDPAGYCLAWCYMYIEVKLMFNSVNNTVQEIDNYINNKFGNDFSEVDSTGNKYLYFIRYYSKYLEDKKNKLLNKFGQKNFYKKELKPNEEKNIIKEINKNLIKYVE
jgi:hypothetical protein